MGHKKRYMTKAVVLLAVAGLAVAVAGCGSSSSASTGSSASSGELGVGISNPMSGAGAAYAPLGQGMQAYFEYQNSQGGIDGRKFSTHLVDSGESATGGANNVHSLLSEEPFMIGIVGSTPFQAGAKVLHSSAPSLPVFGIGNAAVIAEAELENAYGEYPNYTDECFYDAKYAIETLKATKLAIVYENDAVGQGAGKECPGFAESAGASTVTSIALPPETTDFGSIASKVQSSGAEAALIYALSGNVAGVQKAASSVGFAGHWITFSSNFDPSYVKLAGSASEGTYVDSWLEPITAETPAAKLFREQIKKYEPKAESTLGAAGWTMGAVAVYAMKKAAEAGEGLSQKTFVAALNGISNVAIGLAPDVSYAGGDHSTFVHGLSMYQVQGGKLVKVSEPAPIPSP